MNDDDDTLWRMAAPFQDEPTLRSETNQFQGALDPTEPTATWWRIQDSQVFEDLPKTNQERCDDCTRLVLMSDTHGEHDQVMLPRGDVLVHAGDFTKTGELGTIQSLASYFERAQTDFEQIICIAGNHDMTMHRSYYRDNYARWHPKPFRTKECREALQACTYLQDQACEINKGKISVYGSPWTPYFYGWAFNLERGKDIRQVWKKIPSSTDVLITHGPPLGRNDLTDRRNRAGCLDLLQQVQGRIRPRLHVFGHIHEDAGISFDGHTLFINASILDLYDQPMNQCIVVDVPHDRSKPAMLVEPTCNLQGYELREWFERNGYTRLSHYMLGVDAAVLPSGEELLEKNAFMEICDILLLHRDADSKAELRRALSQIYTESFH